MGEDLGEKTEPATERRRTQARERGQVAKSQDFSAAWILLAGIVGLHLFGRPIGDEFGRTTVHCLSEPWLDLGIGRAQEELIFILKHLALGLLGWGLLVVLTALAVHLFQTGGLLVATNKSYFDFSRLNPISGFQRIFSLRGLIKTALDSMKVLIIGVVAFLFISGEMRALAMSPRMAYPTLAVYAWSRILMLSYAIIAVLLVLGIADYVYQRFQWERDLRMTREEVKQETKDIEGDPHIRARRRQIQARLARQRMLREVPEAEVVITNPTELAVAIKYDYPEMDVPIVVAKGAGFLAERIREIAQRYDIPIVENKPLAQLLYKKVEVGTEIPDDTFIAVAEILAYVYKIKRRTIPDAPPEKLRA